MLTCTKLASNVVRGWLCTSCPAPTSYPARRMPQLVSEGRFGGRRPSPKHPRSPAAMSPSTRGETAMLTYARQATAMCAILHTTDSPRLCCRISGNARLRHGARSCIRHNVYGLPYPAGELHLHFNSGRARCNLHDRRHDSSLRWHLRGHHVPLHLPCYR